MKQVPDSLLAFQHMFPDDDACAAWLIEMRWPDGFVCPACGHEELWPRVGDGLREGGGVSWGVTKPPGLQARSDTP